MGERTCHVADCRLPPTWMAFAAYDAPPSDESHPLVHRYPMPQIVACINHVLPLMNADVDKPGSTRQWVVRRIGERDG